jgi:hypothetical protein
MPWPTSIISPSHLPQIQLILSFHLLLRFPSKHLPSCLLTKIPYAFLTNILTQPPTFHHFNIITGVFKYWSCSSCKNANISLYFNP